MKINIAIFQYKMRDESPLRKIQRLEDHLIKNSSIDLIVCPELFLSGYGSFEKIKEHSETSDGEYAKVIGLLAKKYSTAILYGYPEKNNNILFNSAQLFDSQGISVANHRKKLLPPTADESKIFKPGADSHWPAAARYTCRSRAFENGIFVVYANSTGTLNGISFMGESKIIGPDGLDIINAKKGEKVIVGEINTNEITLIQDKLPYLDDARELN